MADEEIVAGIKQVKDEIVQQRNDGSQQTSQLSETINNLRTENSQKSDNLVNTLTSTIQRTEQETTSELAVQRSDHAFLRESGIANVDDEVSGLRGDLSEDNTSRKTLLQRIAAWVNPDMQGSKDRERDVENKLNFDKQLKFFANMSKSLKGMVVKPLRATTAGIWTFLKGLAMGGVVLAILNFLDSETWKEMQKSIAEDLPRMLEELKEAFFGKEGGFINGLKKLAEILGFDEKDAKTLQFIKDHWGKIAIGLIALAAITPAILFGGAWALGRWIFIAPLALLFKKLAGLPGDLTKAGLGGKTNTGAGRASAPGGKFKKGQKYTVPQGGPASAGVAGTTFEANKEGKLGQTSGTKKTGLGSLAGKKVQEAAEASNALTRGGRWKKLTDNFPGLKNVSEWAGRWVRPIAYAITAKETYDILMSNADFNTKVEALGGALVGGLGAWQLGAIGAVAGGILGTAVGWPGAGTLLGMAGGGYAGFFLGDLVGTKLAKYLLGGYSQADIKKFSDENKPPANPGGRGVSSARPRPTKPMAAAQVPTSSLASATAAVPSLQPMKITSPTSLAAAVPAAEQAMQIEEFAGSDGSDVLRGGAGTDTLTPLTPTSGADVTTAGRQLNTASRAATSSIAMGGGAPIVNAPNIVNNNQSSTTVESKKIANASGILHALNYAYG